MHGCFKSEGILCFIYSINQTKHGSIKLATIQSLDHALSGETGTAEHKQPQRLTISQ